MRSRILSQTRLHRDPACLWMQVSLVLTDSRSCGFFLPGGGASDLCSRGAPAMVSLILICGSSDLPCIAGSIPEWTSWTADSLALICGGSGPD